MSETEKTLQDLPEAPQESLTDTNSEAPQETEVQEDIVTFPDETGYAKDKDSKESSADRNFAALRRAKEEAERERDAYFKRLREIEEQREQSQPKQEVQADINDDDLAEGRHLKALKKEIESLRAQSEMNSIETRLKAQFPDFDNVVNQKNIEKLRTAYPEIASTLHSSQDWYNKAASAYTIIKRLGIDEGSNYEQSHAQVQRNMNKPRTATGVSPQQGQSPLTQANAFANGLTDDLKQQLFREMVESRKKI